MATAEHCIFQQRYLRDFLVVVLPDYELEVGTGIREKKTISGYEVLFSKSE